MIKPEDHQLTLDRENYSQKFWNEDSSIRLVHVENYLLFKDDLKRVLSLLEEQLPDWDERPKDFNDIIKRFNSESKCFLFYYNNECIGWNWINEKVRFNWRTIDKDLPEGWIYAGGLYLSNKVDRPPYSAKTFQNIRSKYLFDNGYEKICVYCDSWNTNAVRMCTSNSFINEDWYYLLK